MFRAAIARASPQLGNGAPIRATNQPIGIATNRVA